VVAFIAVSASAHLLLGIVGEVAAGHFMPWLPEYRFAGTLYWNQQGLCCVFLSLSALAAADMAPRSKYVFSFLFILGAAFLVLTKSRSSLVGFGVGLTAYLLLTRSLRFKLWLTLGIGTVGILLFMSGTVYPILDLLSRGGEGADNLTGRVPLWQECLTFAKYGGFWTPRHIDYLSGEFHWPISASHSAYIEALLTLGLVGLLLHVSLLFVGFWRASVRFRSSGNPIFALLASFCLVYLIVGVLEAVLVVEPSPVSFYFALLLLGLCFKDGFRAPPSAPTAVGGIASRAQIGVIQPALGGGASTASQL